MDISQSLGYLKVQAVSAGGALPVTGAVVTVTDENGSTVASLRTDSSGLTETIALNAPPRELSQVPEPSTSPPPFAVYNISLFKEGFYPVEDLTVPVFDGITAIQQTNMIPLTEFSPLAPNPLPQIVETPAYPTLRGNGEVTP